MKSLAAALFLLLSSVALSQSPDIYALHPRPKSAFNRAGLFRIDASTPIVVPDAPALPSQSALYLQQRVRESMGYTLPITPATAYSGTGGILLGEAGSYPALTTALRLAMPPGEVLPDSGGYVLDISSGAVIVAGADPKGTFSGVATLCQLIQPGNVVASIECAHIWDYPDYPLRWVFSQHNLLVPAQLTALRAIEDTMAAYKLNGLQQNDFKYNILDLMPKNYFDNVETLKADSRLRNVEVIPGVASIGYSEGLLYKDPNLAEGLPAVATYVVEADTGRLVPDPRVALPNGSFESVDGNGKFTGWSFYDGANQSVFADRSVYHSGTTSARCTAFTNGNSAGNCRFNRKVDCQPSHYYVMSAWLRTQDFKADMVQLLAIGQDDSGGSRSLTSAQYSIPATSNGWMKVEVVFNTVGYNHLQLYAGCWGGKAGTIWWDDFQIAEGGLTNILRRPGTPLWVRNRRTGAIYREGADFLPVVDSVLLNGHGTYGPYHQAPTFRRATSGGIANGDSLLISYFHPISAVSDAGGNGSTMVCVSEDTLYAILADQIGRVDSLYRPGAFFMGHDEIRNMNWDSACQSRRMPAASLLASNLRLCKGIIDRQHPGGRSFVWSDMFDSLHNAHNNYYMVNGDLSGDWDSIPRSVVIVNWNGGQQRDASLDFFARHGFRQVSSPYYDVRNTANMRAWRLSQQKVQGVLGMMYTTWSADYSFLRPFAYYAWGAGPYIVHAPVDSNVIATMKPGDSILVAATIFADPYDPADSIATATAQFVGYGPTGLQESVVLRRVSGNSFAGYAHGNFAPIAFSYYVMATNAQGLPRVTPTYQYGVKTSDVKRATPSAGIALSVYPNPASGVVTVDLNLPAGPWRLRVIDMLGNEAIMLRGELAVATEKHLPIDIAPLPSGAYRCQIVTASGLSTAGFSVVR